MTASTSYSSRDHTLRKHDRYARAKYSTTMRWILPYVKPGAVLYNIGAGHGDFNNLAARAGLRVIGCEPDVEAFRVAAASLPQSNCELLPLGLEDFARARPPADFIVMHDVLEHIRDDAGAASTLSRLLKPGGRAIVSVPALTALFGLHDEELGHVRRYSKRSLRRRLEPFFTIERIRYFGMLSIPIVAYYSVWKRRPYPPVGASEAPLSRAYGFVCDVESYLNEPLGTAILAELTPRE